MRQLCGWAAASHPFPLAAVLALTVLISFASTGGAPDGSRLALVIVAMLFSQLAIGWSNDYVDREADSTYQPSKPIARGLVEARRMPPAVLTALALSVLAGAMLGYLPLALLVVGTAAGLVYNFRLKGTALSPLPYVVGLAVLPAFVWSSLDAFRGDFVVLYALGASLAVAAHLANVLPDIETDRLQGRFTLAVLLGRARSLGVIAACMLLPVAIVASSLGFIDYAGALLAISLIVYVVLSLFAVLLYRQGRRATDLTAFRCVALAGVVLASGWLGSLT